MLTFLAIPSINNAAIIAIAASKLKKLTTIANNNRKIAANFTVNFPDSDSI